MYKTISLSFGTSPFSLSFPKHFLQCKLPLVKILLETNPEQTHFSFRADETLNKSTLEGLQLAFSLLYDDLSCLSPLPSCEQLLETIQWFFYFGLDERAKVYDIVLDHLASHPHFLQEKKNLERLQPMLQNKFWKVTFKYLKVDKEPFLRCTDCEVVKESGSCQCSENKKKILGLSPSRPSSLCIIL